MIAAASLDVWLLLVVAGTHVGSALVAQQAHIDRAALFYVLRGVEGVFLFGLLLRHSTTVAAVALWGMAEEALTSVCGALYIIEPVEPVPLQGLCDVRTGAPVFTWCGLFLAAALAGSLAMRRARSG